MKIIFKNQRQLKDYSIIEKNIYFTENEVTINNFGTIIINLKDYSENAENEVLNFIKQLNNKNIIYNKQHKKIAIN